MDELEALLRRYRPAGPTADLRGRAIYPSRPQWRQWLLPATAAAAAVLFYALTDSTHRRVISATSPSDAAREKAIAEIAIDLGGDESARLAAERLIVAIESTSVDPRSQGTDAIEEMTREFK